MSRRLKAWTGSAVLTGEGGQGTRTVQLDRHGRRLWDNPGGRRRNFDDATVLRLRDGLTAFLLDHKAATGRLPLQKTKAVSDFVDKLLADEGLTSSYSIIVKQLVRPVFRKLKPRKK
jgi:hypothetical protein